MGLALDICIALPVRSTFLLFSGGARGGDDDFSVTVQVPDGNGMGRLTFS